MLIEIGKEYNIKSVLEGNKVNANSIFRGIVKSISRNNTCNIEVTAYNITGRYKPGDRIDIQRIGLPVHVNSNLEALAFLKKKEE